VGYLNKIRILYISNKNNIGGASILLVSSLSFFIANYLARTNLQNSDYLVFSYYVSLISIIYSYSLTGGDALILKYCTVNNDKIEISKPVLFVLLINFILSGIFFISFNGKIYDIKLTILDLLLINITCGLSLFLSQLYRIKREIFRGQLVTNYWRLILVVPLFLVLIKFIEIGELFRYVFATSFIFILFLFRGIEFSIVELNKKNYFEIFKDWIAFSVSLFLLQLLFHGDKILVDHNYFQDLIYSDYYYFTFLGLMPVNLSSTLISYIFGPLINDRKNNLDFFIKILNNILMYGFLGCFLFHFSLFLIKDSVGINILNFMPYAFLSLIGVIRLLYGILSIYVNLKLNHSIIHKLNIFSFLGALLVVFISLLLFEEKDLILILNLVLAVFTLRSVIFYSYLKKSFYEENY
jgi:hypothetical protein